jgi:hypothetical protein
MSSASAVHFPPPGPPPSPLDSGTSVQVTDEQGTGAQGRPPTLLALRVPCPACGSRSGLLHRDGCRAWVSCPHCGARGPAVPSPDDAQTVTTLCGGESEGEKRALRWWHAWAVAPVTWSPSLIVVGCWSAAPPPGPAVLEPAAPEPAAPPPEPAPDPDAAPELLPCPFCGYPGERALFVYGGGITYIECPNCLARGGRAEHPYCDPSRRRLAAAYWNERHYTATIRCRP